MVTLEEAVWELLETEYSQTTAHLLAALEMDFPEILSKIQDSFREKHGPGCGARMSPLTEVNHTLEQMLNKNLVERRLEDNHYTWRKLKQQII